MAGPGARLKAAREDMGVSAREIADALNLSIGVVEGIEDDDPSRLPPTAFARGYIRSYAKLFDLDADGLVGQFERLVGETPTSEVVAVVAPPDNALLKLVRQRPALLWGGALAILLLIVLLAVWLFSDDADDSSATTSGAGQITDLASASQAPASDAFEPAPTVIDVSEPIAVEQAVPVADEQPEQRQAAIEPASERASEIADQPAPAVSERRLTPDGDDRLIFRFSEDSWLVVSDGTGTRLYSNLGKAGSELRFIGEAPFRLVIGYAPGVRLTFNGDDVRLSPHTRNNKATLFLRP